MLSTRVCKYTGGLLGHSWTILAFTNVMVCKDMQGSRWAPGLTLASITGNDSISYRCVPGVGVSGVPRPDRKKREPLAWAPWHYLFCLAFSMIPVMAPTVQRSWSQSQLIILCSWSVRFKSLVRAFRRSHSFCISRLLIMSSFLLASIVQVRLVIFVLIA